MKILIVTAGRRGVVHARTAAAYPGARVVVAWDPNLARAEQLASNLGAQAYADRRLAIERERPDVVYLAIYKAHRPIDSPPVTR